MVRPSQQRGGVTGKDCKVKHSDEEDEEEKEPTTTHPRPAVRSPSPAPMGAGLRSGTASLSRRLCLAKYA
jgi:hypothetical protein